MRFCVSACDYVGAMSTSEPNTPGQTPTAGNALIGAAGLSARVMASAMLGATAVARAAARPAAAAVRGGLATAPGETLRADTRALVESLDAEGRRDLARARAEIDAALDRVITDALASERLKRMVDQVLDSDELWRLVDRIANSPEVINAVADATVGLTGVVADEARKRTVTADELAERFARRVLRRAPREPQVMEIEPSPVESGTPQP